MFEEELGRGLLKQGGFLSAKGDEEMRSDARLAISRGRRQVWILAGATITLWVVVAACLLVAILTFLTYIYPQLAEIAIDRETSHERAHEIVQIAAYYSLYAGLIWAGLLVLASLATVAFVMVSRQATLRQIQASLEEVARELRSAGAAAGKSGPASGK